MIDEEVFAATMGLVLARLETIAALLPNLAHLHELDKRIINEGTAKRQLFHTNGIRVAMGLSPLPGDGGQDEDPGNDWPSILKSE